MRQQKLVCVSCSGGAARDFLKLVVGPENVLADQTKTRVRFAQDMVVEAVFVAVEDPEFPNILESEKYTQNPIMFLIPEDSLEFSHFYGLNLFLEAVKNKSYRVFVGSPRACEVLWKNFDIPKKKIIPVA